jgi:hypothetical protein
MRPPLWLWWDLKLWIKERREKLAMFLAWRVLPKELRKWVVVRACVDAAGPDKHPGDVTAIEVMKVF